MIKDDLKAYMDYHVDLNTVIKNL
jgi:hypothetical protein